MEERYFFTYKIKRNFKVIADEHIVTPVESDLETAKKNLKEYLRKRCQDGDDIILSEGISDDEYMTRLKESVEIFQNRRV